MIDYEHDDEVPVYVISVAAQLAGLHPQTLRQYDRLGLVSPGRSVGRNRLYSLKDIQRLREVTKLSNEGVTLSGIMRILILEEQLEKALNDFAAATQDFDPREELMRKSGNLTNARKGSDD